MNEKRSLFTALCIGAFLFVSSPVKADDLDERQAELQNRINQASISKHLSSKDAGDLHNQLSTFDQLKIKTRADHGGVLNITDDKNLGSKLGDINQKFDEKVLPEGQTVTKAPKAAREKAPKAEKAPKPPKAEKPPKAPKEPKPPKEPKHKKSKDKGADANAATSTGGGASLPAASPAAGASAPAAKNVPAPAGTPIAPAPVTPGAVGK
jgi:outer membrane biosynthesis protein TonB